MILLHRKTKPLNLMKIMLFFISVVTFNYDLFAQPIGICKARENFNRVYDHVSKQCMDILNTCSDKRQALNGEDQIEARERCYLPFTLDPTYKSPCPTLAIKLESIDDMDYDNILALAYIRTTIRRDGEDGVEFYRGLTAVS